MWPRTLRLQFYFGTLLRLRVIALEHSLLSETHMDNRHLVTRKLGRIPSKNHHGDLISTPPKKSAAQKFRSAGPIRAANTNRTTLSNFNLDSQNATCLKALERFDLPVRILGVLRT